MTAPATANDVVRQLSTLTARLYTLVGQYADAEREAVELRQAADVVEAKAFLRAEGAVETRKRQALIDADDAESKARVAEALVRTLRAKIRATETDIDVHRSFGASIRAELQTLGYGASA